MEVGAVDCEPQESLLLRPYESQLPDEPFLCCVREGIVRCGAVSFFLSFFFWRGGRGEERDKVDPGGQVTRVSQVEAARGQRGHK